MITFGTKIIILRMMKKVADDLEKEAAELDYFTKQHVSKYTKETLDYYKKNQDEIRMAAKELCKIANAFYEDGKEKS